MASLSDLLSASAALHQHLCPRQVLGVRMGMLAGKLLGLDLPQTDKRLLTIVETDGCASDGVAVATGCWVGRRTLRVEDLGKVAATFVDTQTGAAVRVVPRHDARTTALGFAAAARDRWEAHLIGYQHVPDDLLFSWQSVVLTTPIDTIVSHPGARAQCERCGEEIINGREVAHKGTVLCRTCAMPSYYQLITDAEPVTASVRSSTP